jgi:glycosyltransferase involved in cell wall biosynthesis
MMKKAKVLHIITRLDRGGSAENTIITVTGLDKTKYDITLIKGPTFESKMSKEEYISVMANLKNAQLKGVKLLNIPFLLRRINPFFDLLTFFSLYILLIKENPTIVHSHTSKAGLLGRFAARLAGVPIIVHTPHGHVFFGYFGPFKTKIFILLEKLAARLTDKIITLSNREKEDYLSFKIAEEDKFSVICSGVGLNKFKESPLSEKQNLKKELGIPENSIIAGTAGRLVPVKGPEFLIKAARYIISRYPDAYFIFTGDGPLEQDLKRRALKMGISENIIFLGWRDNIAQIISIYDIFVLPSLNEGMGRVLAEAMALGKPIVASNIGGIPDLVIHGDNGFLVPPKNPKQLAKYIQVLIEDKDKRQKMGLRGKEMSLNFGAGRMIEKIASLYEELLIHQNIFC